MRVVLDTDVLVAALRSDQGASRQLLLAALDRRFDMLVSVPLMLEYEAVLTRQENLTAAGITADDGHSVLDALAAVIEPVRLSFLWRPRLRDAADEMVLETAVNGKADRLVTFNLKHLGETALEFGVRAVKPGEALRQITGKEKQDEKKQRRTETSDGAAGRSAPSGEKRGCGAEPVD